MTRSEEIPNALPFLFPDKNNRSPIARTAFVLSPHCETAALISQITTSGKLSCERSLMSSQWEKSDQGLQQCPRDPQGKKKTEAWSVRYLFFERVPHYGGASCDDRDAETTGYSFSPTTFAGFSLVTFFVPYNKV